MLVLKSGVVVVVVVYLVSVSFDDFLLSLVDSQIGSLHVSLDII